MFKIKKNYIYFFILCIFVLIAIIFLIRENVFFTVTETSNKKYFTYAMENNNISIYLLNPNNYTYPSMEMSSGNYFSTPSITGEDGQVIQFQDFLEFQFTCFFKGIRTFSNVFQKQADGKYKLIANSMGNALKLQNIINHKYYQICSLNYQNEIFQFCNVVGEFNGTVLIRKNIKTNKEIHYYFDGKYNIYFSENTPFSETNSIYISKDYKGQGNNNKLEIWKYNIFDSSVTFVDCKEGIFDYSSIAVNNKNEIFVAFAQENKKTWGIFLNTGQIFESALSLIDKPIFRDEGVYMNLEYRNEGIPSVNTEKNGLYLLQRDGTIKYIENQSFIGTFYDNTIISMFPSERYDYLEMIVTYRDMAISDSGYIKKVYPPKKKNNKVYNLLGWSYEDDIIYGYYISEDCEEVEKFIIN